MRNISATGVDETNEDEEYPATEVIGATRMGNISAAGVRE